MARISGIELPLNKNLAVGLSYVYGIGKTTAMAIIGAAGLDASKKIKDLSDAEVAKIQKIINENYKVEGDKRREVQGNIKQLMEIGCYRGIRHRKGLPVRGQRTRTNARTRKGKKKTVMASKKEAPKKG
ncbi:MAG: 30S ribosomal protein S13 [Elusimicrobia bacterium CG_4_10_14_3_um_filter_49_12_50_7]|nr:MAG: 30S ribosomal protein S13 [Elusimicrobia bacterium CG03_land_8_20_14_0_80_50_18]PIX13730.1 MAG: 30S ribosomal protein S13 [Elusimicrobia bacterium CG_4_8_14_3_um_filter_50_9]PIY16952.1 MAG: 30S ribosomal protein S13 [Elusimicrobia bacterium CG_4_10_14_3_um_filter_49_12_50_7]